jgi:transcription elongation factor GreA
MQRKEYFLTKEGLKNLKNELGRLKAEDLPLVVKRVSDARELGKLEDNQEFDEASRAKNMLEGRIDELEEIIKNASIIDHGEISSEVIQIGSTVTVEVKGDHHTFTIVGSVESDPSKGKISHESPVGKKLLGLKEGDVVKIQLPHATIDYRIKKIHK